MSEPGRYRPRKLQPVTPIDNKPVRPSVPPAHLWSLPSSSSPTPSSSTNSGWTTPALSTASSSSTTHTSSSHSSLSSYRSQQHLAEHSPLTDRQQRLTAASNPYTTLNRHTSRNKISADASIDFAPPVFLFPKPQRKPNPQPSFSTPLDPFYIPRSQSTRPIARSEPSQRRTKHRAGRMSEIEDPIRSQFHPYPIPLQSASAPPSTSASACRSGRETQDAPRAVLVEQAVVAVLSF
ncbi:hypothetical protein B0H10DRAFT_2249187 [Mycena sp. CBHHK59/15]|nr:hypothetical protein B0H10DRAFT_2249187 [Mycena sp. CBHHK59/15]